MSVKPKIHGSFKDSNDQYLHEKMTYVLDCRKKEELILWKNDKGNAHLFLDVFSVAANGFLR